MTAFVRFASACLLAASLAGTAEAANTIVVDVATGKVLSEKNANQRWYPASTTKLMTAYVALQALKAGTFSWDSPVVMTRSAAYQAPSKMGFKPGSVMRFDNAMHMMLVKSANDVAYAIGQTVGGGSIDAFVASMNEAAAALGMQDTHFVNPNGLPQDGQYSSAKDLALLAIAIRKEFPDYSSYFGTEGFTLNGALTKNSNGLLGRYKGADGMKTGYICASGFNLVASATRDNRTLVAVVLGAEGPIVRERTAAEIFENGFNTNPRSIRDTIDDMPASSGPPADISAEICSAAGRTARANERKAEDTREETFGSPYMTELDRPRVTIPVRLGGAAAGPGVEANVAVIADYGIPVPTWRPDEAQASPGADGQSADSDEDEAANNSGQGAP